MTRTELYKRLRDAVEAQGSDSGGVEGLSVTTARSLIGPEAKGVTTTLIRNAKRTLAAELRRKEMQATADWIVSGVKTRFADVEVKVRQGRVIEVWLDGLPKEIE